MSQPEGQGRGRLFGAIFFPVVAVGILILVALLVVSYTSHSRSAPSSNDRVQQLSDGMIKTFREKYDALGESAGSSDASVTVREFGDYQCPACRAFEATAQKIRKNYVNTGKVRFIFFDFPLTQHPNAETAAIAARCAGLQGQGKFWDYHARVYQSQAKWEDQSDPVSTFLDLGLESGVDTGKLKSCIADKTPLATIKKEKKAGEAIKLLATPTVIVGKTLFVGGADYETMKQAIESALADTQSHPADADK